MEGDDLAAPRALVDEHRAEQRHLGLLAVHAAARPLQRGGTTDELVEQRVALEVVDAPVGQGRLHHADGGASDWHTVRSQQRAHGHQLPLELRHVDRRDVDALVEREPHLAQHQLVQAAPQRGHLRPRDRAQPDKAVPPEPAVVLLAKTLHQFHRGFHLRRWRFTDPRPVRLAGPGVRLVVAGGVEHQLRHQRGPREQRQKVAGFFRGPRLFFSQASFSNFNFSLTKFTEFPHPGDPALTHRVLPGEGVPGGTGGQGRR